MIFRASRQLCCTFEKAQQHYVTYSTGATRSVNTNAHSREGKRYGSPSAVIAAKAEGNARARSSCSTYTSAYTAQQVANALLSSFRCSHARFSNSLATPRFSVPFCHAFNLVWVLAFTNTTIKARGNNGLRYRPHLGRAPLRRRACQRESQSPAPGLSLKQKNAPPLFGSKVKGSTPKTQREREPAQRKPRLSC